MIVKGMTGMIHKMEVIQMSVFKSYLRKLLKDLKDIDEATPDNELTQKAKGFVKKIKENASDKNHDANPFKDTEA